MHPGAIAALLLALSFTLFEIYTVKRSGYRMQPTYILDKYVASMHGTELCGEPTTRQRETFDKKYVGVRRRTAKSVQTEHPDYNPQQVEAAVVALEAAAKDNAAAMVQAGGCQAKDVRRLLLSFEMRTR